MGFLTRLVSVGVFLTRLIVVVVVVQRVLRGFLTRLASDGGWGVQAPYDNSHLLVWVQTCVSRMSYWLTAVHSCASHRCGWNRYAHV